MRVVKNPEERRGEILDTAELLFASRGYVNTTINDILGEIGIAKGTFYYYFKSKEEVMDAIIARTVEVQMASASEIAGEEYLSVSEKIFRSLMLLNDGQSSSRPDNAEMQQKILVSLVRSVGPIIAGIIEEGKREGMFTAEYPLESVELLMISYKIIFDEVLFPFEVEERISRARCFAMTMESALGAPKGSLGFISELLSGYPAL